MEAAAGAQPLTQVEPADERGQAIWKFRLGEPRPVSAGNLVELQVPEGSRFLSIAEQAGEVVAYFLVPVKVDGVSQTAPPTPLTEGTEPRDFWVACTGMLVPQMPGITFVGTLVGLFGGGIVWHFWLDTADEADSELVTVDG
jgi:hypothetical protein